MSKAPAASNIYRDAETKNLIHSYAHSCMTNSVNSALKGDSLPDVSKKASVD